jgi:uncharacterized protein YdeI (YjbR/CyaY-like superfamily)
VPFARFHSYPKRSAICYTHKWGIPVYTWNNENITGLAAFKSYVGLWFSQGALLGDDLKLLVNANEKKTKAMRQMRFTSKNEINADIIEQYVFESVENFKAGLKIKPDLQKPLIIPDILSSFLRQNSVINEAWNELSLSNKREYAEFISEAKKEETQLKRLAKIKPMILERKGLNDKYK